MTGNTKAILTLNSFEKGGDGGGPSECDNQYKYTEISELRAYVIAKQRETIYTLCINKD